VKSGATPRYIQRHRTNHTFQGSNIDSTLAAQGINAGGKLEHQWTSAATWAAVSCGTSSGSTAGYGNGRRDRLPGSRTRMARLSPIFKSSCFRPEDSISRPELKFIGYYGQHQTNRQHGPDGEYGVDTRYVYWVESHTQKLEAQHVRGNAVLAAVRF
jgi:hypothetical protein